MITFGIISAVVCLVLAGVFMYFRITEKGPISVISKTMASLVFVMAGIYISARVGDNAVATLVPVGLICGMLGDILLELKVIYSVDKKAYYYAGCVAFAIGHLFYGGAVCAFVDPALHVFKILCFSIAIGLAVSTVIMLFGDKLKLDFGEYFWVTYVYSFMLVTMVALSVWVAILDTRFVLLAIGMVAFFASDLVLSMQYFGEKHLADKESLVIVNHGLYYLAQVMVVIFLAAL